MKKLLYVLGVMIILSGCSVMKPRERSVNTFFLDYRPYAEEGFFLSPDPYPGQFTSLGDIRIEVQPAMIPAEKSYQKGKSQKYTDGMYASSSTNLVPEEISGSTLLDIAVQKAKELGADGIANLKIRYVQMNLVQISKTEYNDPSYWEITGLCISRK